MLKKLLIPGLAGLLALAASYPAWDRNLVLPAGQFNSLAAHPDQTLTWLASSADAVYIKSEQGWNRVGISSIRGIRKIISDPHAPGSLFILTKNSIYQYSFTAHSSQKIFERNSEDENFSILSFAVLPGDPEHFFVGTSSGLFESDNSGKQWFPFEYFKNQPVNLLRFLNPGLYLAAGHQLYFSNDLVRFHPLFSLSSFEASDPERVDDESASVFRLRDLCQSRETLWLATDRGVFQSPHGRTWSRTPGSGLRTQNIHFLTCADSADRLFAGTAEGVYQYALNRFSWEQMNAGLSESRVVGLMLSSDGTRLTVLTPSSLYEIPTTQPVVRMEYKPDENRLQQLNILFQLEPSVRDLQKKTISANDLSHAKIKRWHAASRLSAFLPSVSFGKDLSRSNSIDIDRGGTNDADRYIVGPEDINQGWDFDVSWDLGDFLFSTAQTSIDSRSKLNSEARRDFLSEVSRLYFERRRLQMEIVYVPAESELSHHERLLRMDELTSLLDGLTRDYLSLRLRRIYSEHPELEDLWIFAGPLESGAAGSGQPAPGLSKNPF